MKIGYLLSKSEVDAHSQHKRVKNYKSLEFVIQ